MTAQDILDAFIAEERVEGFYSALTEEEQVTRNTEYTQLKINVAIEEKKKTDFYSARELARSAIVVEQTALMTAFNTEWQAAEDNDLTIPE